MPFCALKGVRPFADDFVVRRPRRSIQHRRQGCRPSGTCRSGCARPLRFRTWPIRREHAPDAHADAVLAAAQRAQGHEVPNLRDVVVCDQCRTSPVHEDAVRMLLQPLRRRGPLIVEWRIVTSSGTFIGRSLKCQHEWKRLMTACGTPSEKRVRSFLPAGIVTCSMYVPGQTLILSPDEAAVTADWMSQTERWGADPIVVDDQDVTRRVVELAVGPTAQVRIRYT